MTVAAPSGKRLERLVAALHHAESAGGTVVWNDVIEGRQFDVTVRFKYGTYTYLTVIECKEYSSKVSVEKVDALVTKARDAKANKAIMISTKGFQSGCFPVAERHGVQLLVLTETSQTLATDLVAKMVPGLNLYDVRFGLRPGNGEVELEDWGGRLAYLMRHAKIVAPAETRTPDQLVNDWQLTGPSIDPSRENQVEIALAPNAELHLPHEDAQFVSSMRFACSLIEVAIPKQPMPDNHILEAMSSRVELRDSRGQLHHATQTSRLPLGFDGVLKVGSFYEQQALCNRYYCEKIDGEMVTWILVESYQHGHLFQATLKQKIEFSKFYVEVTDEKVLIRLRAMLARVKAKK